MSINAKITAMALSLSLIPLIIAIVVMYNVAVHDASKAVKEVVDKELIAIRGARKDVIEDYFNAIRSQIISFSNDRMVINAMREFTQAYEILERNTGSHDIASYRRELTRYYRGEFDQEYSKLNQSQFVDVDSLVTNLDDLSIYLQYHYIQNNSNPLGEKHRLDGAQDGSVYSQVHQRYHPHIRQYLELFEYYDIFLVHPESGDIIYSVFKELDYSTSLKHGSYSGSGIGRVFDKVAGTRDPHDVAIVDFEPYLPSYEAPASFIASPIFDGQDLVGVLIFQMPVGRINSIMTSDQEWKNVGLGNTGEAYLVGPDSKARSTSRYLLEQENAYLKALAVAGVDSSLAKEIAARGDNVGFQNIDTQGVRSALNGETTVQAYTGYMGYPVLSASAPLDIDGLDWGIVVEMSQDEAYSSIKVMTNNMLKAALIITLVIAVIACLVGVFLALRISTPIRLLSQSIQDIERNKDLTMQIECGSSGEIGDMTRAFNGMLGTFKNLILQVITAVNQLSVAAEQMSQATRETRDGANEQRQETVQLAIAMNEMALSFREVASNASDTSESASQVTEGATTAQSLMTQASESLSQLANNMDHSKCVTDNLNKESEKIGEVLDVIRGVADQTNLLALNAAIEAARAGEQGRGFAVVADEVRTLAVRTQSSTDEIQEMIRELQRIAREVAAIVDESNVQSKSTFAKASKARESVDQISSAISLIDERNAEIACATEEQSTVAGKIHQSVSSIQRISESTDSTAEETLSASQELAMMSSELRALVNSFKVS